MRGSLACQEVAVPAIKVSFPRQHRKCFLGIASGHFHLFHRRGPGDLDGSIGTPSGGQHRPMRWAFVIETWN